MGLFSKPIIIEDYQTAWELQFELLAKVYKQYLGNLISAVEHVGSTAIPGLCAKPVIDIDIVIDSVLQVKKVTPILVKLGYQYLGEVGIPERFVFRQLAHSVPNDGTVSYWPKHHLYCCVKGSTALKNHLFLRDTLLNDEDLKASYAQLKRNLAKTAKNMDEYVMGKTDFITKVLADNGMSNEELLAISEQNKTVIPSKISKV